MLPNFSTKKKLSQKIVGKIFCRSLIHDTSRGYPWTYWRIPKCVTGLITRRIMVPDLFFLELMLLLLAASQFPINFPSCQLILPSFQCSLFFSFQQVFLKVFQVSNCFLIEEKWFSFLLRRAETIWRGGEAILGDPRLGDPLFGPNQSPPRVWPGLGEGHSF